MPSDPTSSLAAVVTEAAHNTGLSAFSPKQGADFHGKPTTIFELKIEGSPASRPTLQLELSEDLNCDLPGLRDALSTHLREESQRLLNPVPNASVTFGGIPLLFQDFRWPFHRSTSGADTYIVHGVVSLADGSISGLHAKVSASMTVTFADALIVPEQPFAETFIYNSVRKVLDQGQLEMLKSGNRQPVPVTTRYYSRWQKKFFFTETTPETRQQFLMSKAFWLSGILGQNQPIWTADPRDAQYLNATVDDLLQATVALKESGWIAPSDKPGFAAATPALMARESEFRGRLAEALEFAKPTFNEEMRAGHTNM
jgi:hypothetical protein